MNEALNEKENAKYMDYLSEKWLEENQEGPARWHP